MTARINDFRAAAVARIHEAMPHLRECSEQFGRFDLDELETTMVRAPAVRVAVLSARVPPQPSGQADADLACAAFVVTEGARRDAEAWTIAEAVATLLHPAQLFGLTRLGAPGGVAIQPVVSGKLKARSVAIVAVEWRQPLRQLGDNIFDEQGRLLTELYINGEEIELPAPPAGDDAKGDGDGA